MRRRGAADPYGSVHERNARAEGFVGSTGGVVRCCAVDLQGAGGSSTYRSVEGQESRMTLFGALVH